MKTNIFLILIFIGEFSIARPPVRGRSEIMRRPCSALVKLCKEGGYGNTQQTKGPVKDCLLKLTSDAPLPGISEKVTKPDLDSCKAYRAKKEKEKKT